MSDSNKVEFKPQPGPQEQFLSSGADIAIYGGARGGGKSYGLLIEPLRHIHNPRFSNVIFRRTYPQIMQEGGLWETSEQIYPYFGAVPHKGDLYWRFPKGATVSFAHMENLADRYAWLGASIPLISFDELATFAGDQFFFMLGSNRSTCGVRPYIRGTTNPEARTWLANLIQWWWDPETGYPIPERAGIVRYFVRYKDHVHWADTAKELKDKFPFLLPKSLTFIPARVTDNKILMEKDPGYMANLMALSEVDKERFLNGNWKIVDAGGTMFRREWFRKVKNIPPDTHRYVRYWDLAATAPNPKNPDPDWTSGCLMAAKNGAWFIVDMQRFRGTPKEVEKRIVKTAQEDPVTTAIRMEQEPGASGKIVIDHYERNVLAGRDFKGIPSLRKKTLRAKPFSAEAEHGNVYLVEGDWNGLFLDEAENFRGSDDEKNDQIDSATGAHNELQNPSGAWTFAMPAATGRFQPVGGASFSPYRPIGF